jgi:molybdopterin-guanine dinucleotide biosynthesis protein A
MISVVIQAGGKSMRMGRDKAFLPFPERPLIAYVADRMMSLTDDLIIISPREQDLAFLGLPVYPDIFAGTGPLGGLYTGLYYARYEFVAVIACDMPFASPALVQAQFEVMQKSSADVVLPVVDGKAEPLHALYRRETCRQAVRTGLEAGMRRLVEWHASVRVQMMSEADIRKVDPLLLSFFNINTTEDLEKALILAGDLNQ